MTSMLKEGKLVELVQVTDENATSLFPLQQLEIVNNHAQDLALIPLELPPECPLSLAGIQMHRNSHT
jgi:hypothetical protein